MNHGGVPNEMRVSCGVEQMAPQTDGIQRRAALPASRACETARSPMLRSEWLGRDLKPIFIDDVPRPLRA